MSSNWRLSSPATTKIARDFEKEGPLADTSMRAAARPMVYLIVVALLSSAPAWSLGKADSPKAELEQKLNAQFALAKLTADKTDIVTPGSVFVLQKGGLLMCSADTKVPPTRFYRDGNIVMPIAGDMGWDISLKYAQPGATSANVPKREAAVGEKLVVSQITVRNEGVIFRFYSERYENVRYYGQLVFPYDKKSIPAADDLLKTIAEVITPQSAGGSGGKTVVPIPPPPPPPDTPPPPPKTVALGQTKDQVVATFGQPQKAAAVGAKEIYYYPDMKVTFVDGKVSDVQ
jgi:hypothetical protein